MYLRHGSLNLPWHAVTGRQFLRAEVAYVSGRVAIRLGKITAFWATFRGFEPLSYILLGSRYVSTTHRLMTRLTRATANLTDSKNHIRDGRGITPGSYSGP